MNIRDRLGQFKAIAIAVAVAGFIKRHKWPFIVAAMALFIAALLLGGTSVERFVLNLAGLGIASLMVRRILQVGSRMRSKSGFNRQRGPASTHKQGGTP